MSAFLSSFLRHVIIVALTCILTGCYTMHYSGDCDVEVVPQLTAIHLVDRNGMTETISSLDRLEKYANIDFLHSQPYAKVLRVYGHAEHGEVRALITSYYENGQLSQYLEVANNRAYGHYREWHENGQMSLEAFVIGGMPDITPEAEESWLFDGCCRAWDEQGTLTGLVQYVKGKLEGESLYYHSNGQIWKRAPFVAGELMGTCEVFYSDGKLLQRINHQHNRPHGPACRYWQNGTLAVEEEYCNGMLHSGRYYDPCGILVSTIEEGNGLRALFGVESISELHEYREGVAEGEVRQFDTAGHLVRRWHVKGGVKHGTEIEYYMRPSTIRGRPKLEVTWYEGKIHGLVKTWYPEGGQESQREMSNNVKNGLLTAWYRDNSLMLVEEYENDQLLRGEYYRRGERVAQSEVVKGEGIAVLYDADGNFLRKIHYCDSKPFE